MVIEFRMVTTLERELLAGKRPNSGTGIVLHLDLGGGYSFCTHVKIYEAAVLCTFLYVYYTPI